MESARRRLCGEHRQGFPCRRGSRLSTDSIEPERHRPAAVDFRFEAAGNWIESADGAIASEFRGDWEEKRPRVIVSVAWSHGIGSPNARFALFRETYPAQPAPA